MNKRLKANAKNDLAYMAATIYGEARGEPFDGKKAVGHVINNRLKGAAWYGKSVKEVCLKPWQFSCWNLSDPNYELVKAVKDTLLTGNEITDGVIGECINAAKAVMFYDDADNTKGSLHYHSVGANPYWTSGKEPVVKIGRHLFYNDID